jgi:hypothetical protein
MLLAPMVVNTRDTALDDAEKPFRRVRVDALSSLMADVLFLAMGNLIVGSEMLSDEAVRLEVIGHDCRLGLDVPAHDLPKIVRCHPVNRK